MATETENATDHSADASGAVDAAAGHAPAESGMPQLNFETFPNQIFWLVVALVVIYFILSRVALPRIASVLAERQSTVTNDLAAAEDLKAKAVDAEEAYNKALADARSEAQSIIAAAKEEMKAELEDAIAKADAEIAARAAEGEKAIAEIRANAEESVKEVAKETAKELVAAMGAKADARSVTTAVNSRLKG